MISEDLISAGYSHIMRELNKKDKDLFLEFQKEYKKAFDEALLEGLDGIANVALLQAIKKTKLNLGKI